MNCREWETRIALRAGGDLPGAEALEMDRHLAGCPGCREFASSMTQDLELLRAMHREPVAEAHLAALRVRVLTELERAQKRRRVWIYGLATAAALAVLVLTVAPQAPKKLPRMEVAVVKPAPSMLPAQVRERPLQKPIAARPMRRRRRTTPAPAAPPAPEPLVVKLMTEDPNVVIYWIAKN